MTTLPVALMGGLYLALSLALCGWYDAPPTDLAPAEPEPPTLLQLLYRKVGRDELADSVINHRTETTEEES